MKIEYVFNKKGLLRFFLFAFLSGTFLVFSILFFVVSEFVNGLMSVLAMVMFLAVAGKPMRRCYHLKEEETFADKVRDDVIKTQKNFTKEEEETKQKC